MQEMREAFLRREYLFTAHGSNRAAQRGIRAREIEEAISNGELIEDYPGDKYGPSCLIFGYTTVQRPLHIQVSYPPKPRIITVYQPSLDDWESDLKTRRSE